MADFTVHNGQRRLLQDTNHDEHAIIAGYGYGKTSFLPRWHYKRIEDNPDSEYSIVIAPNHRLLKNWCLAEFESFLKASGLTMGQSNSDFRINLSPSDMKVTFRWGQTIFFISSETPTGLVSYNVSHISIDEPALMDEAVIERAVARLRCPKANYRQILFTGTPEGLNWFHERFHPDTDDFSGIEGDGHAERTGSQLRYRTLTDERWRTCSSSRA